MALDLKQERSLKMSLVDDVKAAVIGFLETTPIGLKMNDERRAAVQATRAAECKAIGAVKARLERELPPLRAAEESALEEVKKARADLAAAEGRWSEKHRRRRSAQLSSESEISRYTGLLLKSADPGIDKFLDELRDLAEKTRGTRPETEDVVAYPYGIKHVVGVRSNIDSIRASLRSVGAAIAATESLKLVVYDDLAAELAKIREMIRPVEPLSPSPTA